MKIRALTREEWKYVYTESQQIAGQTGNIGHLRGYFDGEGDIFDSRWFGQRTDLKTEEFKREFDEVINTLRSEEYGLLKNRFSMRKYVGRYPDSAHEGNYCTEYGFRVSTDKYAYLLRCNTNKGYYCLYCYCYIAEWLDRHIKNAAKGIRFITPHYEELFCIPDGEKIVIEDANGKKEEARCRYIDDYHVEINERLFHICQFAELMQQIVSTCTPLEQNENETKKNRLNQ